MVRDLTYNILYSILFEDLENQINFSIPWYIKCYICLLSYTMYSYTLFPNYTFNVVKPDLDNKNR